MQNTHPSASRCDLSAADSSHNSSHNSGRSPRSKPRRAWLFRAAAAGAAALAVAALPACTSLVMPNKVTLSQAQLQGLMEHSFPIERELMQLFEMRATAPHLQLLPQSNRMAATVDLSVREKILSNRMKGRLNFDSGLRWEPSDNSVRLDQVRVQDLTLDALPAALGGGAPGANRPPAQRTGVERMAASVAERVLEDMVLYRLPADKLADMDKLGVRPGKLTITERGLEINLEPKSQVAK